MPTSTNPFDSPPASDDEGPSIGGRNRHGGTTDAAAGGAGGAEAHHRQGQQRADSYYRSPAGAGSGGGGVVTSSRDLHASSSGDPATATAGDDAHRRHHHHHAHHAADDADSAAGVGAADVPIESSWHFLGDLPYRRVPLYDGIDWNAPTGAGGGPSDGDGGGGGGGNDTAATANDVIGNAAAAATNDESGGGEPNSGAAAAGGFFGLAAFPPSYLTAAECLDVDLRELLSTTTTTLVAGCPHGGPIAALTAPKHPNANMNVAPLRIMTASGRRLATVDFPPRNLPGNHVAADVLTMGFTSRMILLVILRDSTCLTYDAAGVAVLPPFAILPSGGGGKGVELLEATVYEGGAAVLSTAMHSALVEVLDEHDDPAYVDGANLGSRRIVPAGDGVVGGAGAGGDGVVGGGEMFGGARGAPPPPHFAIVTPLPTAANAHMYGYGYCTIAVLPRIHTASRRPEVFLSTSDNSVVIVDTATTEITDVDCRARIATPIVSMSFAPNGRFLACFTEGSILTVISTTFETKVLDFDTSEGSPSPPREMKWCGEDSVVLHWRNLGVLMVGPYGDWLRFPYDDTDNLHIVSEVDCCRVVTDKSCEILQRVPPGTAALLRIGSIEPAAMLLDASDAFEAGSPGADEAARAITRTGMLGEAIDACTVAAAGEFDVPTQKRLLRAASYGMHFTYKDEGGEGGIMGNPWTNATNGNGNGDGEGAAAAATAGNLRPSPEAFRFVAAAKKIRVLNVLRHPTVGFTLTSAQYDEVTPTGMVARLVAMKRPALATSVCSYLSLDRSVEAHARASRAASFVASDRGKSDAQTADGVIKILTEDGSSSSGPAAAVGDGAGAATGTDGRPRQVREDDLAANRGTFAAVALAAHRAGRPGVASLLLTLETSAMDKVPALVAIGSYADAAAVAVAARDVDLIFLVLMEFEKACMASSADQSKGKLKFIGTVVSKFPKEASDLLRVYYSSMSDVKAVNHLLFIGQNFIEAGSVVARRALDGPRDREHNNMMKEASRIFGLGKDCTFQKSCTDDYLELLTEQARLRSLYECNDIAPEGASVTETLVSILSYVAVTPRQAHKLFGEADKLARKFRVPEKRLWYIKVHAFSTTGQWPNLQILANSRAKSPIGFKPFALAVIRGKQPVSDIMRYVERVNESEDRYSLFCEAKLWQRALEEAMQLKDGSRIMHVRSICNNPEIQQLCDQLVSQGS